MFSVFAGNSTTFDFRNCVDCITVTRMCRGVNVPNSYDMYTFFILLMLIKFFSYHVFYCICMNSVCG